MPTTTILAWKNYRISIEPTFHSPPPTPLLRALTLSAGEHKVSRGKEMSQFLLVQEDWDVLKWLAQGLEIFWTQTQRL
jgi:hypothetical protein